MEQVPVGGQGSRAGMKPPVLALLIALSGTLVEGCTEKQDPRDLLGKKISDVPSAKPLDGWLMVSSGRMDNHYQVTIGGLVFTAGVDGQGVVEYLSTLDPSFRTPEGARVGMTLEEAYALSTRHRVEVEEIFGSYVALPSGWNVGFAEGSGFVKEPLLPRSLAVWLFLRNITRNSSGPHGNPLGGVIVLPPPAKSSTRPSNHSCGDTLNP